MPSPARRPRRLRPMLSRTVDAAVVEELRATARRERRAEGRIIDDALRLYFTRGTARPPTPNPPT